MSAYGELLIDEKNREIKDLRAALEKAEAQVTQMQGQMVEGIAKIAALESDLAACHHNRAIAAQVDQERIEALEKEVGRLTTKVKDLWGCAGSLLNILDDASHCYVRHVDGDSMKRHYAFLAEIEKEIYPPKEPSSPAEAKPGEPLRL